MLTCPKCGYIAVTDTAGNVVCINPNCNQSAHIDMINEAENGLTLQSEKMNKVETEVIENSNVPFLRYYYVEYKEGDDELFQTDDVYGLIEKRLKQEGEFSSFVERCYKSFRDSDISEIVQFYNHFSQYTIEKISGFNGLTVVYEKE